MSTWEVKALAVQRGGAADTPEQRIEHASPRLTVGLDKEVHGLFIGHDNKTTSQAIDANLAYTQVALSTIDAIQIVPGDAARRHLHFSAFSGGMANRPGPQGQSPGTYGSGYVPPAPTQTNSGADHRSQARLDNIAINSMHGRPQSTDPTSKDVVKHKPTNGEGV